MAAATLGFTSIAAIKASGVNVQVWTGSRQGLAGLL
jgi:hypothetical protein